LGLDRVFCCFDPGFQSWGVVFLYVFVCSFMFLGMIFVIAFRCVDRNDRFCSVASTERLSQFDSLR
jgi:hypothetical protein